MKAFLVLLAALPLVVHATDKHIPTPPPTSEPKATSTSTADSHSQSSAASNSTSAANSNVDAHSAASVGNVAPVQSLALSYRAAASTAYAPDIYPTAPCINGWSVGGSSVGGGISFGKGREVEGCVERELIRIAAQMGLSAQAAYMWCSLEPSLKVFGSIEACLAFRLPAPPVAVDTCELQRTQAIEKVERVEHAFEECQRK